MSCGTVMRTRMCDECQGRDARRAAAEGSAGGGVHVPAVPVLTAGGSDAVFPATHFTGLFFLLCGLQKTTHKVLGGTAYNCACVYTTAFAV